MIFSEVLSLIRGERKGRQTMVSIRKIDLRYRPSYWIVKVPMLLSWLLLIGCSGAGTLYAPGYSEAAFRKIEIGTSEEKVVELLGEPLRIVGDRYYYYYDAIGLVFLVDEKRDSVVLAEFSRAAIEDENAYASPLSISQLTSRLGSPKRVIGVDLGQSDDRNIVSYIYSRQKKGWPWWNYRKIDVDKSSGKVVDKVYRTMD